jgi:hypothetical protein
MRTELFRRRCTRIRGLRPDEIRVVSSEASDNRLMLVVIISESISRI